MQSGKIKRWYQEKGYGFIEVDNQNEDVFFHVSKVRLSHPISIGQQVYFNSERNAKNQLRATEVTSSSLSILEDMDVAPPQHAFSPTARNQYFQGKHYFQDDLSTRRHEQPKKSVVSTLFIIMAVIAVAVYVFGDLTSSLFIDSAKPTVSHSFSETSAQASTLNVTGDAQVDKTLTLIQQGGPFPYPQKDGTTFYNREGKLPAQSQGYYREYTVPTPGLSHRGARRIVTGGYPPTVYYLTVDHYESFRRLQVK
ncbi:MULTISPECIES: ribonuclease domain-containing protein [Psychrobacter]|uniref:Ribonuclease n=1 Tax=Psychrobacter alimentarius TaxID=261164 RepID=A0ABM5ZVF6_9GAMM|nr:MULTISPECIES: ribonuclease domain-containing protein [Psychrobacter]AMT96000.1 Ribonuclease [Psychrobacter alimentarius]QCB31581.1 DNA-binding protein [Psychrobacter sp. PAMC27889]